MWDPPVLALIAVAAGLVYGIWRLLSSAPLPGKLRRWGQLQLPAGECGLTFAQFEETSRDFTRTFAAGGLMLMSAGEQRAAEPLASLGGGGQDDVAGVLGEFEGLLAARLAPGSAAAKLGAAELVRRLVGHLSVTPALQFALW